jgi:hypothetical protein
MQVYCFDNKNKPQAEQRVLEPDWSNPELDSPAVQRRNRIGQMEFALETNVDRMLTVLEALRNRFWP